MGSTTGGYQFIYGGPYQADEVLEDEFDGIARPELIAELADELSHECWDWSGRDDGSGADYDSEMDDYVFRSLATSTGHHGEFQRSITDIQSLLYSKFDGAPKQCLLRLLYVNVITALEAYLADFFSTAVTQNAELRRKFVESNPDFIREKISISEIFQAREGIDKKVNQYLVDIVWHHLYRVKPMFRSTLGIEFPKDMDNLFTAVLVRHDLVHRNGRKRAGGEHILHQEQVEKLIEITNSFVEAIEEQWRKVTPSAQAEVVSAAGQTSESSSSKAIDLSNSQEVEF